MTSRPIGFPPGIVHWRAGDWPAINGGGGVTKSGIEPRRPFERRARPKPSLITDGILMPREPAVEALMVVSTAEYMQTVRDRIAQALSALSGQVSATRSHPSASQAQAIHHLQMLTQYLRTHQLSS